ncbi:MAG: VOC family protein [Rhizobiaceae bacterium]
MAKQEMHRGRLIDHIQLVVKDLAASRKFYEAVGKALGIPIGGEMDGFFYIDELGITSADSPAAQGRLTGRVHLAFQAKDRAMVDAFHKAGLANGGADNGAPGERKKYHPGYYAGFLLDPDGNNIEAVYHGPHERSADSVKISFEMP